MRIHPSLILSLFVQTNLIFSAQAGRFHSFTNVPSTSMKISGGAKSSPPPACAIVDFRKVNEFFKKPEEEQVEIVESKIDNLPLGAFLLVYPALTLLSAPFFAPYSKKFLEGARDVSQLGLAAVLTFLSKAGDMTKIMCDEISNQVDDKLSKLSKVCKKQMDILVDVAYDVVDVSFETCQKVGKQVNAKASAIYGGLCTITDEAIAGILSTASTVGVVAEGVRQVIVFLADESVAWTTKAAMFTSKEAKALYIALAALAVDGFDWTVNYLAATGSMIGSQLKNALNLSIAFIAFAANYSWEHSVAASIATILFVERMAIFAGKSLVTCAEKGCQFACFASKTAWTGIISAKRCFLKGVTKTVDFLPFLERDDGEVVITKPAQTALYLSTLAAVLHPSTKVVPTSRYV